MMKDEEIREVGQQIIEKYGRALRKMAERDQYGQPEEELIDDNSDDDGDEERFGKFVQWQMEKEASAIEAALQVTMDVDPEL